MKKFAAILLALAMSAMMILPAAGKSSDDKKAEKLARAEAVSLMRLQRKLARNGVAPNDVKTLRVFEDKDKADRVRAHTFSRRITACPSSAVKRLFTSIPSTKLKLRTRPIASSPTSSSRQRRP